MPRQVAVSLAYLGLHETAGHPGHLDRLSKSSTLAALRAVAIAPTPGSFRFAVLPTEWWWDT